MVSKNTSALIKLRRKNKTAVLYKLMSNGETSRTRLARELGLTAASVTQLVQDLIAEGVVAQSGEICAEKRGRKEIGIRFISSCYAAIGVNIESDNTHISVCEWDKVLYEEIIPTAELFAQGVDRLGRLIAQICALWDFDSKLLGISVGIVGAVDEQNGIAVNSYGILPENYPLAKELKKRGIDANIVNNIKAQARALIKEGNENFLYVKHSPGIGCALVAHGQTVDGNNGLGSELGHTIVRANGLECRCGKRGCLEAYASEKHIQDVYLSKTGVKLPICDIYAAYGSDETAKEILDEVMDYTALSIGNATMITNPERVIVTGGMFMCDELYARILDRLYASGFNMRFDIDRIGNDRKIKAFAEAKHYIRKRLFEV